MGKNFINALIIEVFFAGGLTLLGFLMANSEPCLGMCYIPGNWTVLGLFVTAGSWLLVILTLVIGSTRSLMQKRSNPLVGVGILIAILLFGLFLIWKVQQ